MKAAILGGTFDPIHKGHKQIAKTALEKLGVDEVWFMPARLTPLKDHSITNANDRLAMLEAALHGDARMKVCDLELRREGRSYTIDTVRQLQALYPDIEFTWLIGADQLAQFDKWKDADELVQRVRFVCVGRSNIEMDSKYPIEIMEMEPVDVSSSEIRKFEKLEYLDEEVLTYIYRHALYLGDYLKGLMPAKRWHHSLMVAALCQAMAVSNGLDPAKAYLTGLLHDVTKYMPFSKQKEWMEMSAPAFMHLPTPVWHGFTGAWYVKNILKITDPDVIDAIYWHVLGQSRNPYAMLVFCADKLDPLRDYNSSALLKACMHDLEAGFEQVQQENRKYLKKEKK